MFAIGVFSKVIALSYFVANGDVRVNKSPWRAPLRWLGSLQSCLVVDVSDSYVEDSWSVSRSGTL